MKHKRIIGFVGLLFIGASAQWVDPCLDASIGSNGRCDYNCYNQDPECTMSSTGGQSSAGGLSSAGAISSAGGLSSGGWVDPCLDAAIKTNGQCDYNCYDKDPECSLSSGASLSSMVHPSSSSGGTAANLGVSAEPGYLSYRGGWISFRASVNSKWELTVYDMVGSRVVMFGGRAAQDGMQQFELPKSISKGLYIVKLEAAGVHKRMVLEVK